MTFESGEVTGTSRISWLPEPKGLRFGVEDQKIFTDTFRSELQRLGIARTRENLLGNGQSLVDIKLIFARTFHRHSIQEYSLNVVMEISGGRVPFLKQYRILSSKGDTHWQKGNTNASQGKAKAGKHLMDALIPDVESYIASNK